VQPDALERSTDDRDPPSDADSQPADDDEQLPTRAGTTTPPPPGLESTSAPPTPIQPHDRTLAPSTEGKDTRSIRRRVEALEWEDGQGPPGQQGGVAAPGTGDDTEIADVAAEVSESAAMLGQEEQKDVEIANVADEVSTTAAELGDLQDKAMDVADVAADVAVSAEKLAKEDAEQEQRDVEIADVAAEVATSARGVEQKEQEDVEVAKAADEVSESSKLVTKEEAGKPAPPAVRTVSFVFSRKQRGRATTDFRSTVLLGLLLYRLAVLFIPIHCLPLCRRRRPITSTGSPTEAQD
jgi:hypothetical protein